MDQQDRQEVYSTPCQRCGSIATARASEDHLRRAGLIQVWCYGCQEAYRQLAHDVMNILEQHAGFTQEHRAALAHLAELAVNDPQKALTVQSLSQRVESLEKAREDRKWRFNAAIAVCALVFTALGLVVAVLRFRR